MESLLKKKKSAKGRKEDGEPHTVADPSTQEVPTDPPPFPETLAEQPSPHEPSPLDQPRIKTREAVSARENGARVGPSERGRAELPPRERMEQRQIKTRESTVHDDSHSDVQPVPPAGSEPAKVWPKEPTACDISENAEITQLVRPEPPKIKTRDDIASAVVTAQLCSLAIGRERPTSGPLKPRTFIAGNKIPGPNRHRQ